MFTSDLTASDGDYDSKSEVITLDSTNTARNFVVTILNDNTVENSETFSVNITTDESQVRIQDETLVITILDDDSKFCESQCNRALYISAQYSFSAAQSTRTRNLFHVCLLQSMRIRF